MAKKKEPCVADALMWYKSVIGRSFLSTYLYVNKVILYKTRKDSSVLVIPEDRLWEEIVRDDEMKSQLKELDMDNPEENSLSHIFSYADNLYDLGWVELPADRIHQGDVIKLKLDGINHDVSINRALIPLKLKKTEATDISYRVVQKDTEVILLIKKKFTYPMDGCGFTMMRIFRAL